MLSVAIYPREKSVVMPKVQVGVQAAGRLPTLYLLCISLWRTIIVVTYTMDEAFLMQVRQAVGNLLTAPKQVSWQVFATDIRLRLGAAHTQTKIQTYTQTHMYTHTHTNTTTRMDKSWLVMENTSARTRMKKKIVVWHPPTFCDFRHIVGKQK